MKHTFRYCATHREDEAYMQAMCARGWAAVRLVEGFWTFAPCTPGRYCYRVGYLRGKTKEEVEALQAHWARQGVELVSRYSFWAIFRSTRPFSLYTPQEEREICQKIYAPMPAGAVISWLLTALGLYLTWRISLLFLLLTLPLALYGAMCTWLAHAYHRLLQTLPGA